MQDAIGRASDFELARQALAADEFRHALHHLSGALAKDPQAGMHVDLLREISGRKQECAAFLADPPHEAPEFYGLAATRAWLEADAGHETQAVQRLLTIIAAYPSFAAWSWLDDWIVRPGFVERLEVTTVSNALRAAAEALPESTLQQCRQSFENLHIKLAERLPSEPIVAFNLSRFLRQCGFPHLDRLDSLELDGL